MAERCADMGPCAAKAAQIYRRDAAYVESYRGGMPAGFMAACAQWDSEGQMGVKGDVGLGEYGIFQISAHTEEEYGVPAGTRLTKTGNYFLAGVDMAAEAVRVKRKFHLDGVSTEDLYKLSRLVYSIGRPGTYIILKLAMLQPGEDYYQRLMEWSDWALAAGKIPKLGSQSPSKVHFRIKIADRSWRIAELSGVSMAYRDPVMPPSPPNLASFRIPKDLVGHIRQLTGGEKPGPEIERTPVLSTGRGRVFAFVMAATATVITTAVAVIISRPKLRKSLRAW